MVLFKKFNYCIRGIKIELLSGCYRNGVEYMFYLFQIGRSAYLKESTDEKLEEAERY